MHDKIGEQRLQFLGQLYQITKGYRHADGPVADISRDIGLPPEATEKVVADLVGQGFIEWRRMGFVGLTQKGVEEIERSQKSSGDTSPLFWTPSGEAGGRQPLDIEAALKSFTQKFTLPPDSLPLYSRLWQLERWLRQMVYVELKSARGPAWTDTLKSIAHSKGKDKDLIHMLTPEDNPLAYHTLGELWEIMKHGGNWALFEGYFPPKHVLEVRLAIELGQIRHRVMHCRTPHPDDLGRVEQFLRDVDHSFWRFTTSYNKKHYIIPYTLDSVADKFIEDDQYPWTEVKPNEWCRLGRVDLHARFWLTIDWTIRPWVDKARLSHPPVPAPGVLYNIEFHALDQRMIDYDRVLTRTKHLHPRCIHVLLDDSRCTTFRVTLPSVLPVQQIIETVEEFREQVIHALDSAHDVGDKAERIAAEWPEYVLPPFNPLAFLYPDMPATFFSA